MAHLRFNIEPRDVPAQHAARRLGLTEASFAQALPGLMARGFPAADPTTGNFDLDAVDAWRRRRNPDLFGEASSSLKTGATARARLEALRNG